MRNANTLTVRGLADVTYVFDRIESGTFQKVDFIEAYVCPDGCVSGQLTIAGRYAAQRNLRAVAKRLGRDGAVKEEKVRTLLREHFFDFETEVRARPVPPIAKDVRGAVALVKERNALLAGLPIPEELRRVRRPRLRRARRRRSPRRGEDPGLRVRHDRRAAARARAGRGRPRWIGRCSSSS